VIPFVIVRAFVVILLLASASTAHADAIAAFEGECPPGLRLGHANHAEVCEPIACESASDCPSGSACNLIHECWAPRPYSGGRMRAAEVRDTVIGLCATDGTCAEGECLARHQCEPSRQTDAWDPRAHRWTQVPYSRPLFGCATTGRGSALALGALVLAALARRYLRFAAT
jgi:hypothetical protein